jgi:hypothetical protein
VDIAELLDTVHLTLKSFERLFQIIENLSVMTELKILKLDFRNVCKWSSMPVPRACPRSRNTGANTQFRDGEGSNFGGMLQNNTGSPGKNAGF